MSHEETTLGDPVRITYSLDKNGTPTSPDRLTLLVRSYSNNVVPIDEWTTGNDGVIIEDSAGRFHAEVNPDKVGQYAYRWEAFDGSDQVGAAEGEFIVRSIFR